MNHLLPHNPLSRYAPNPLEALIGKREHLLAIYPELRIGNRLCRRDHYCPISELHALDILAEIDPIHVDESLLYCIPYESRLHIPRLIMVVGIFFTVCEMERDEYHIIFVLVLF